MRYDAGNRVMQVSSGPFMHRDAAGNEATVSATESFSYDARGNKSTHTDARGYTERFHFDAYNRLASQWDGQRASVISTLRTDHVYDSFDRLIGQRRTDTASLAVQTQGFEWSQFDQRTGFTDALGYRQASSYDANGRSPGSGLEFILFECKKLTPEQSHHNRSYQSPSIK